MHLCGIGKYAAKFGEIQKEINVNLILYEFDHYSLKTYKGTELWPYAFLRLGIKCRWVARLMPRPFRACQVTTSLPLWTGIWEGTRFGVDAVEKRKLTHSGNRSIISRFQLLNLIITMTKVTLHVVFLEILEHPMITFKQKSEVCPHNQNPCSKHFAYRVKTLENVLTILDDEGMQEVSQTPQRQNITCEPREKNSQTFNLIF